MPFARLAEPDRSEVCALEFFYNNSIRECRACTPVGLSISVRPHSPGYVSHVSGFANICHDGGHFLEFPDRAAGPNDPRFGSVDIRACSLVGAGHYGCFCALPEKRPTFGAFRRYRR